MKGVLVLVIAVGGIVSVGCGVDWLRTLSQSDVVGIPPGDATGSLFAGQYMLTQCLERGRVGVGLALARRSISGWAARRVMQTDGMFQFPATIRPPSPAMAA